MIIMYPMIVSKGVSENIVPGLTKTVEQYIIVNAKDTMLSNPEVMKQVKLKIKGGKLFAQESVDLSEAKDSEFGGKTKKTDNNISKTEPKPEKFDAEEKRREAEHDREEKQSKRDQKKHDQDMIDRELKRAKDDKEAKEKDEERKAKKGISSVKMADNKALSIEPTTVDVEFTDYWGNKKLGSIGVKVVPFRVKSEAKLSRLIMHDVNLKGFSAMMISQGRKITRRIWGFIDRWAGNLKLGGLVPTGDPRRDIIMARTGFGGGGYIVLSKTHDIDESFLNNVKKINRLYKMGWGNLIVVDDVNRMAYFCLKQFRGVCTAISFAMIYHNFKALQVYDSLEDAKRQTSSIFKIKKQFSKVVAEWIVDHKRAKYLSEDK